MPYPSFKKSVKCLDYRRLGKQRVEAKQILDILLNRTNKRGWHNHPAVKMWVGYEEALKLYYDWCIAEWINRGYKNNMPTEKVNRKHLVYPWWFGNYKFHKAHKSNLLRKNFEYYKQFGWELIINLPYIWPKGKDQVYKIHIRKNNHNNNRKRIKGGESK
ncbi:MAG: MSMEG_6728 family protein [Candidatus Thorarchaeota archaeon]